MFPERPPDEPAVHRSERDGSLLQDERGIEGLPIRLVIALVVGVAALAIMMSLLDGVGSVGQTEVDVEIASDSEVIYTNDLSSTVSVEMDVVSEDGEPVEDGRVMVQAGSAQLDTPQTEELTGDNTVTFEFDDDPTTDPGNEVDLRADQNQGTLEVEIFPPSDSDYTDSLRNSEIIVIEGSSSP